VTGDTTPAAQRVLRGREAAIARTKTMILDLLISDGFEPKKVASTRGGEYASSCPGCGGRDRFRSWPEQDRYWCRQCEKSGDAIQYLRDFHGMSFRDAADRVGKIISLPGKLKTTHGREKIKKEPLPLEWTAKAEQLVDSAHAALLANQKVLDWLHTDRGLTLDTVKRHRLGWLNQNFYRDREAWGLPALEDRQGRRKRLFIPSGLVIPYQEQGKVIRVRVRRDNPGNWGRYYILPGSDMRPMVIGEYKPWPSTDPVIVAESELDALLMAQEIGNVYTFVALGSASARPTDRLAAQLQDAPFIIVCLDTDEAGDRATGWWLKKFDHAVWFPVPPEFGKDQTEAFLNGLDFRVWLEAAAIEVNAMSEVEK